MITKHRVDPRVRLVLVSCPSRLFFVYAFHNLIYPCSRIYIFCLTATAHLSVPSSDLGTLGPCIRPPVCRVARNRCSMSVGSSRWFFVRNQPSVSACSTANSRRRISHLTYSPSTRHTPGFTGMRTPSAEHGEYRLGQMGARMSQGRDTTCLPCTSTACIWHAVHCCRSRSCLRLILL